MVLEMVLEMVLGMEQEQASLKHLQLHLVLVLTEGLRVGPPPQSASMSGLPVPSLFLNFVV